MVTGKVSWFSDQRGYGFIEANDIQYFAHYKEIQSESGFKKLKDGELVEFLPLKGDKGMLATSIRQIGNGVAGLI